MCMIPMDPWQLSEKVPTYNPPIFWYKLYTSSYFKHIRRRLQLDPLLDFYWMQGTRHRIQLSFQAFHVVPWTTCHELRLFHKEDAPREVASEISYKGCAPWVAKLVYNFNNYGFYGWYIYKLLWFMNQLITGVAPPSTLDLMIVSSKFI